MENKFTNIKERVVKVSENKLISKKEFYQEIKMTSANFRGKAKNTPLNSNTILNIITKFPDVDLYWLITGVSKSEFLSKNEVSSSKINSDDVFCDSCNQKVKIISILQDQIEHLRLDIEDLKTIIGLRNK